MPFFAPFSPNPSFLTATVLDHRRLFRWWRVVVFFYDGPRAKQRTHGVEKGLIKHFSTSKKMFLSEKWSGGVNFYYSYPLLSNVSRLLFMWFFSPSYPLHIWPGGKMRCKWYPRYCFLPLYFRVFKLKGGFLKNSDIRVMLFFVQKASSGALLRTMQ